MRVRVREGGGGKEGKIRLVTYASLVPRLSLLPRNNSTYDLWPAGQRSYVELLRGRRESLGTRLTYARFSFPVEDFVTHQWNDSYHMTSHNLRVTGYWSCNMPSTPCMSMARGGWKRSRDHALPHARLYILLIEKLFLLQRQVACWKVYWKVEKGLQTLYRRPTPSNPIVTKELQAVKKKRLDGVARPRTWALLHCHNASSFTSYVATRSQQENTSYSHVWNLTQTL